MDPEWIMVRLRREVHARLSARAHQLEVARQMGGVQLPDNDGPLSLSDMVERMLDHMDNDSRRKRESRARVTRRKAVPND